MSKMKDEIRDMLHKLATGGFLSGSCDTDEAVDEVLDKISQNYIPKERVLSREEIQKIVKDKIESIPIKGNLNSTQALYLNEGAILGLADALLKAGSIEKVGVEELEEIIETWFVKQESILSNEQIKEVDTKGVWQVDLKSLSFDEIKKGLAQAILNKLKEKE